MLKFISTLLSIAMFAFIFTGCSGEHGPPMPVVKKTSAAKGTFKIDGVPPSAHMTDRMTTVVIKLYPKGRRIQPGDIIPTSDVAPDGTYQPSSFVQGDGIPAGEYVMCFEWLTRSFGGGYLLGPDRFKNNFNNPLDPEQAKYSIAVEEGKPVKLPDIDIKMADLVEKEASRFATPNTVSKVR